MLYQANGLPVSHDCDYVISAWSLLYTWRHSHPDHAHERGKDQRSCKSVTGFSVSNQSKCLIDHVGKMKSMDSCAYSISDTAKAKVIGIVSIVLKIG